MKRLGLLRSIRQQAYSFRSQNWIQALPVRRKHHSQPRSKLLEKPDADPQAGFVAVMTLAVRLVWCKRYALSRIPIRIAG